MKQIKLEFSRPLTVAKVPSRGSHEKISADPGECKALGKRFQIPAVHALSAHLEVHPWRGGGYRVIGTIKADIEQTSVVSLENFRTDLSIPVTRYFLPRVPETEDEADIDPLEHGEIDLGEIVAETVALDLDPYPRKEGEVFATVSDDDGASVAQFPPTAAKKPSESN